MSSKPEPLPEFSPRPIPPLIFRHAQDAAWYWTQIQADRCSPLVDFDRQAHFHKLLAANLDGLRFAGDFGWETAQEGLMEWKGAGEAFVCWLLALESGKEKRLEILWPLLAEHKEHYFAVASALSFMAEELAVPFLEHWLEQNALPRAQALALNAFGLRRQNPACDFSFFFRSEHKILRAEACRLTGRLRRRDFLPHLLKAAQDAEDKVRKEAGTALLICGNPQAALPLLREAALAQYDLSVNEKGLAAILADSRANLLARLLGHALPSIPDNHPPDAEALSLAELNGMPEPLRVKALAHHGDPRHIPALIAAMDTDLSRLCLWAMCFILGLDADEISAREIAVSPKSKSGSGRNNPDAADEQAKNGQEAHSGKDKTADGEPTSATGEDADPFGPYAGLPDPDKQLAETWWKKNKSNYPPGRRLLCGLPQNDNYGLMRIMRLGYQDQRLAASICAAEACPEAPWLDVRAPLSTQIELMEKINAHIRAGN